MLTIVFGGKFPMGRVVFTPSAVTKVPRAEAIRGILRHFAGDWGDLDEEDRKRNDDAALHGGGLLSRYRTPNGTVFWVITEQDRSVTTVLLPNDS